MTQDLTPEAVAEPTCLISQAKGRAAFLRDRGEVKTPDLLEALAAKLAEVEADNADLRLNMDADLTTMCRERVALQAAEAELDRVTAALEAWTRMMDDPIYDAGEMICEFDKIARAAFQPKETDHE